MIFELFKILFVINDYFKWLGCFELVLMFKFKFVFDMMFVCVVNFFFFLIFIE